MCNSSTTEELFRVRFLYLLKNRFIKKVRYLRIVPTRKSLIYSAVNNIDDDADVKDVHISVESVPLRGGQPEELVSIKFSDLCEKLFRG